MEEAYQFLSWSQQMLEFICKDIKMESISLLHYKYMQEDSRVSRHSYSNVSVKNIQNWDDFRKTFKPIKLDFSINQATQEQLLAFWQPILTELSNQTERICILVPSKVSKPEPLQGVGEQTKIEEPTKKAAKNAQKQKGKEQKPNNEVPLQNKVVETAIQLVKSSFAQLDCDYSSLFLGNDKQLLIYRRCFAIEKYIQKYRLPKPFQAPFEELSKLVKELYQMKIKRNRALSIFDAEALSESQKAVETIEANIKQRIQKFTVLFNSIIADFLTKPKCKEIVLMNVPQQLIDLLRPLVQQTGTELINRFNLCDNDQFKDVLIIRQDDLRLKAQYDPRDYQQKIEYVYVDPEPVPEPPKDIRDINFLKIDLQKQCYLYRVDLPSGGKNNPLKGLFIRSEQGGHNYELNIDIKQGTKEIEVNIYPYQLGKSIYEIYTWNQYGFTKSTQKIVLFNQMPPPPAPAESKLRNLKIYLLGETEFGLYPERTNTQNKLIPFSYKGKQYSAKDISLGNAVVICDVRGDVAGWGEMYCPQEKENEQPKELKEGFAVQELLEANLRVETPCLLLQSRNIRKVSCGNGYCLMTSIFGAVFSMGYNQFGQLGLGHLNSGEGNMHPSQICKFTNSASPFIVDVQATICGASFAFSDNGQAYRWGYNQVEESEFPIYDRFNSIINYRACPLFYKSPNPSLITKHYFSSSVKTIQAGNNFFIALDESGNLYGWGQCKFLGMAELRDRDEAVVFDIINPIQIMSNIQAVTVGFDHCVAITKNGQILAWGNSSSFSKKGQGLSVLPVNVSEEYGGRQNVKLIRAGRHYTAILTSNNEIAIIGKETGFGSDRYSSQVKIHDLVCSYENMIGALCESN